MSFLEKLTSIIEQNRVLQDEPMKAHTTFRVGGNADYFVCPNSIEEVKNVGHSVRKSKCILYFREWKQSSCRRQRISRCYHSNL